MFLPIFLVQSTPGFIFIVPLKFYVFQSILLNGYEDDEHMLYDLTLVDLLRSRYRSKLTNVPRFFIDSALSSIALPGLGKVSFL